MNKQNPLDTSGIPDNKFKIVMSFWAFVLVVWTFTALFLIAPWMGEQFGIVVKFVFMGFIVFTSLVILAGIINLYVNRGSHES